MTTTIPLTRFNKMTNDARSRADGAVQDITNFDVLTNAQKIVPYRSSESGDTNGSTDKFINFCYTNGALYGLGPDGSNPITIQYKTDYSNGSWLTKANNTGAITSTREVFVPYHGLIYGLNSSRNEVWSNDPTGANAFNINVQNLSGGANTAAQGVVHSKDDILYIPWGNNIATNNNGSWNSTALVLPTEFAITSICEFGNYLAIACAPISGLGRSIVYLWDRDSSLTTLSESIDFGEGQIRVLENLSGILVGISISSTERFNYRVIFRTYTAGDKADLFEEIVTQDTLSILQQAKQVINNRLYFMMAATINGTYREGVWSIGRIGPNESFGVIHERTVTNDADISAGTFINFIFIGDYLFQSYIDNNGNYQVSKTDDQANYNSTSFVETLINPEMPEVNRVLQKKLKGVCMTYDAFPSGGTAVLQYSVDGSAYTTCFTETKAGVQKSEAQSALGKPFTDGRDYKFRATSTGGVEITGIVYSYDIIKSIINP